MPKYHVTINSDHWQRNYPKFTSWPVQQRTNVINNEVARIQRFLEETPPPGIVSLLVTTEEISIVPVNEDVIVTPIR